MGKPNACLRAAWGGLGKGTKGRMQEDGILLTCEYFLSTDASLIAVVAHTLPVKAQHKTPVVGCCVLGSLLKRSSD